MIERALPLPYVKPLQINSLLRFGKQFAHEQGVSNLTFKVKNTMGRNYAWRAPTAWWTGAKSSRSKGDVRSQTRRAEFKAKIWQKPAALGCRLSTRKYTGDLCLPKAGNRRRRPRAVKSFKRKCTLRVFYCLSRTWMFSTKPASGLPLA